MTPKTRKDFLISIALLSSIFLAVFLLSQSPLSRSGSKSPRVKVMLIGIDAGSWDILKELMADGRLPHFKKLVQEGSAGHLESFQWRELVEGIKGYFSPIVWASIGTGKMPDKHGIEDFKLPIPSELIATIKPQNTRGYAMIQLPELAPARSVLLLKARNQAPERRIGVYLNQTLLKEVKLGKDWKVFDIEIPPHPYQPKNQLNFYYEIGQNEVGSSIADFNYIRAYDRYEEEIFDLHFLRDRNLFLDGWEINRPTRNTLASSFQLRTKTLWDILSERKKRVGVVGWWESWPAPPVNGYLISSHVGLQGERIKALKDQWLQQLKNLTYPENYLKEVQSRIFLPQSLDNEIRQRFYDMGQCSCVGSRQDKIFRTFYWQDRLFETLSLELLKNKGPFDLFAVYFRGVDSTGHQFIKFRDAPDAAKECTGCDASRLSTILDNYYIYMDEVLGRLLQFAGKDTVTMIVTDHGQFLEGLKGIHRNNGFIILHGGPVRTHVMQRARVLDVTPTALYVLGLPVAQDMDGSVLLEAFHPAYLERNPVSYKATYETLAALRKEKKEVIDTESNEEGMEELKALGYIQK